MSAEAYAHFYASSVGSTQHPMLKMPLLNPRSRMTAQFALCAAELDCHNFKRARGRLEACTLGSSCR
jgi:hypothetical protein